VAVISTKRSAGEILYSLKQYKTSLRLRRIEVTSFFPAAAQEWIGFRRALQFRKSTLFHQQRTLSVSNSMLSAEISMLSRKNSALLFYESILSGKNSLLKFQNSILFREKRTL
jgi:hypothetical protein